MNRWRLISGLVLLTVLLSLNGCFWNRDRGGMNYGDSEPIEPVLPSNAKEDDVVYSRYNIHYFIKRGANVASYANYVDCPGHAYLPYNTKFKVMPDRRGFALVAVDTGMKITYEYKAGHMHGMPVVEYIKLITSTEPVNYDSFNEIDNCGMKYGTAIYGMSKQGVMIALGYPAKHQTPSTDMNRWYYWRNRFQRIEVSFDEEGRVYAIQ